jgi:hypothetical protein
MESDRLAIFGHSSADRRRSKSKNLPVLGASGTLPKIDAFCAHTLGQPVVLIDSLGLLERLNQSVQKDSVIIDATLMMFVEGVHRLLLCGQIPGSYRSGHLYGINELLGTRRISRAKPLPS